MKIRVGIQHIHLYNTTSVIYKVRLCYCYWQYAVNCAKEDYDIRGVSNVDRLSCSRVASWFHSVERCQDKTCGLRRYWSKGVFDRCFWQVLCGFIRVKFGLQLYSTSHDVWLRFGAVCLRAGTLDIWAKYTII